MSLAELKSQIQELSKIDKLRLMQFLATELVIEEDVNVFVERDDENELWSQASQLSLDAVWNNTEDDVYAELL